MDIVDQLHRLAESDDAATLIAHRFVLHNAAEEILKMRSGAPVASTAAGAGVSLSPDAVMMIEQMAVLWPMMREKLLADDKPPRNVTLDGPTGTWQ